jgi:hypothetical protein
MYNLDERSQMTIWKKEEVLTGKEKRRIPPC